MTVTPPAPEVIDQRIEEELRDLLLERIALIPADQAITREFAFEFCRAAYGLGYQDALKAPLPEETQ